MTERRDGHGSPIRVVIADDSAQLRYLLTMVMDLDPRFEVIGEAGDGVEALALLDTVQPDLLLLDIGMPRMGGMEVLDRLDPDTSPPVVMLTGASVGEEGARELGASAYLPKHGHPSVLLDRLEQIAAGVTT